MWICWRKYVSFVVLENFFYCFGANYSVDLRFSRDVGILEIFFRSMLKMVEKMKREIFAGRLYVRVCWLQTVFLFR